MVLGQTGWLVRGIPFTEVSESGGIKSSAFNTQRLSCSFLHLVTVESFVARGTFQMVSAIPSNLVISLGLAIVLLPETGDPFHVEIPMEHLGNAARKRVAKELRDRAELACVPVSGSAAEVYEALLARCSGSGE